MPAQAERAVVLVAQDADDLQRAVRIARQQRPHRGADLLHRNAQIRRGIVRNYVRSAGLYGYLREPSPSVRIIVENGRVSLEGYVSNRGTANLMGMLANQVPGVFEVRNNLVIGNGRDR